MPFTLSLQFTILHKTFGPVLLYTLFLKVSFFLLPSLYIHFWLVSIYCFKVLFLMVLQHFTFKHFVFRTLAPFGVTIFFFFTWMAVSCQDRGIQRKNAFTIILSPSLQKYPDITIQMSLKTHWRLSSNMLQSSLYVMFTSAPCNIIL